MPIGEGVLAVFRTYFRELLRLIIAGGTRSRTFAPELTSLSTIALSVTKPTYG